MTVQAGSDHPVTFGLSLDPSAGRLEETRQLAHTAEDAGLDYLAVQDHPYNRDFLDVMTLIGHLASSTERIAFFPDVADLQLRPPTMLAKAAASLSVMVGGRIILGVGGGASADGVAAMGGTRRSGRDMVSYTEEALQILRGALAGETVQFHSGQHAIEGYAAGPVPPAPVPLWLGASGPRMLELTGRASDGWICPLNIYFPPEVIAEKQQLIDNAARGAGRDPAGVRRIYNVIGAIGASHRGRGLVGDIPLWIDSLTRWAIDLGFDTFIFWPKTEPLAQVKTFAADVVPEVRRRVNALRGRQ